MYWASFGRKWSPGLLYFKSIGPNYVAQSSDDTVYAAGEWRTESARPVILSKPGIKSSLPPVCWATGIRYDVAAIQTVCALRTPPSCFSFRRPLKAWTKETFLLTLLPPSLGYLIFLLCLSVFVSRPLLLCLAFYLLRAPLTCNPTTSPPFFLQDPFFE